MIDAKEASAYILMGVIQKRISLAWLTEAFDESNPHCYFPTPDDRIIDYLFAHGGVISNRAKFNDYITPDGVGRLRDIWATITGLEIREDGNTLDLVVTIKAAWQRREAISALETAKYRLQDDSSNPVEILQSIVNQANQLVSFVSVQSHIKDGNQAVKEGLELLQGIVTGGAFIKTGFPTIDIEGGLERNLGGEPKIGGLGGIPGSGKTAVSGQIAFYVAKHGGNVFILEGEMSAGSLMLRQAVQNTGITRNQLLNGKADPEIVEREIIELGKLPIRYITKPGLDAFKLLNELRRAEQELDGLDLVIIDHVKTMSPVNMKISVESPEYINQIYRDLKTEVAPHINGAAWLVLQHLNLQLLRTTPDKQHLTPTLDDFAFQTGHIFNQAYITTLYKNHGKQLPAYSRQTIDDLWETNPDEARKRDRKAYVHCVKNREGTSGLFHEYEFHGALYKWIPLEDNE